MIFHGFPVWGLGALTLAILFGIIAGNTVYPTSLNLIVIEGVKFAKHYLLRAGIILYGFRLTFQSLNWADVGATGLIIDAIMLTSTLSHCNVGGEEKYFWS